MFRNNNTQNYVEICQKLGYQFKHKKGLLQALTRKAASYDSTQDASIGHNQRLELLGDRVIDLAITDWLFETYPHWQEGQLTEAKSQLVNNKGPLVQIANSLNLQEYLIAGHGEDIRQIRYQTKTLSDAVEALFGAIFLDCDRDYNVIRELVKQHWSPLGLFDFKNTVSQPVENNSKQEIVSEDELDTNLIKAVRSSNESEVYTLLKNGANPNLTCQLTNKQSFGSILQLAVILKNTSIVEALIEFKADVNWHGGYQLKNMTPIKRSYTLSELMKSLQHRNIEKVFCQKTALHYVTEMANKADADPDILNTLADCLLNANANVNLPDHQGITPIQNLNKTQLLYWKLSNKLEPSMAELITQSRKGLAAATMHDMLSVALSDLPEEFIDDLSEQLSI